LAQFRQFCPEMRKESGKVGGTKEEAEAEHWK